MENLKDKYYSSFKSYDVRGIYGKTIDEKLAYLLGYYFIKFYNLEVCKVAFDCRLSSKSLAIALSKGILKAGGKVDYLGMLSTVNFYHSLFKGTDNGIMITASHNPKEHNGFKLMKNLKSLDLKSGLDELRDIILKDKDNILKTLELEENLEQFLEYMKDNPNFLFGEEALNQYKIFLKSFIISKLTNDELNIAKKLNFGIDFSNGVTSLAVKEVLKDLNFKVNFYNDKPNGEFPNHLPNPFEAEEFIKNETNDENFYIVFDGDGDRAIFYDKDKNLVENDYVITSLIDFFHKTYGENRFVTDLRISHSLLDFAKENNIDIKLIKVGRSHYQNYMKENDIFYGAELSGHSFFKTYNYLDNPDVMLFYSLKSISNFILTELKGDISKFNLRDFLNRYVRYYKEKEVNLKINDANKILSILKEKFKDNLSLELDGLTFDFGDWWFNIRKSNTEPLVRINIEGKNKEFTLEKLDMLKKIIFENQ